MKPASETSLFQNTDDPCSGQNTARVLERRVLRSGILKAKSTGYARTQNTDCGMPFAHPCSGISCLVSVVYARTQNTEFSTLRGRCPPRSRRGRPPPTPGRFPGPQFEPNPDPTTATRSAKNMITVVFHPEPSHQKRRQPMADMTLITAARGARIESPPATQTGRTIMALDLGTATGWALRDHTGLITSGTVSFRPTRFDGGGMRYLRFTHWLTEIDRLSGPIATIYFEEVRRHIGTDAAHVFGGLLAVLTSWAELRGVPYQGVPVGTIKKHATGKGNANKQAMIDAARALGFSPADDNEADAIAILLWAIETKGGVR